MTEAGPLDMIDDEDSDQEDISLPGVLKGDMSSRKTKPEIRVKCVRFSPTGKLNNYIVGKLKVLLSWQLYIDTVLKSLASNKSS